MKKFLVLVGAVALLSAAAYEANQDRLDSRAMHAMQVCVRAQHDHRVLARSFNLPKCVDWTTVNDEDDDT